MCLTDGFPFEPGLPRCPAGARVNTRSCVCESQDPKLVKLYDTAIADGNIFAVLVDAVRCCSLGQITTTLYEVGGQYRRSM